MRWRSVLPLLFLLPLLTLSAPLVRAEDLPTPPAVLVLLPGSPGDPLLHSLQLELRRLADQPRENPVLTADQLMGPIPADLAAWRQAGVWARASLWFMRGRQCMAGRLTNDTLLAFAQTRQILAFSPFLVRGPMLASLNVLSGRIQLELGSMDMADVFFHNAVAIDPSFPADQLKEGAERSRFQEALRWSLDAPRLPLFVRSEGSGTALLVNGTLAEGGGPEWLLELSPGEHVLTVTRPGAIPASAGVRLEPGAPMPRVTLLPLDGKPYPPAINPFSLAEAQKVLTRATTLLKEKKAESLYFGVVTGVLAAAPATGGPRVGVRGVNQVAPGPDTGEVDKPASPEVLEIYKINKAGQIFFMGQQVVRPLASP